MKINAGGRGKKAPYETEHIRVPKPLIPLFKKMTAKWLSLLERGLVEPDREVKEYHLRGTK